MLNTEQKACNAETMEHISKVRNNLNKCIIELIHRGELHDQTKLASPEVELFTEYTKILSGLVYGSPEYTEQLKKLKPALDHHYAHNRHHPEHHKNGVNDMDLIDILEMLCDWKAATERHNTGNILKSIEHNTTRFEISPQLAKILENTVKRMFS